MAIPINATAQIHCILAAVRVLGKRRGTHHFSIPIAAWRTQSSREKQSNRYLLEQTRNAKGGYPFLLGYILTHSADF